MPQQQSLQLPWCSYADNDFQSIEKANKEWNKLLTALQIAFTEDGGTGKQSDLLMWVSRIMTSEVSQTESPQLKFYYKLIQFY